MEELVKCFHQFWIEVAAIIIVSLFGIFYKSLRQWATNICKYIFQKRKQAKQCSFESCRFETGIIKTLEKIQSELHPNGGSSLRDAINRIDIKVSRVSDKINTIQVSTEILSDTLNICRWSADKTGGVNYVNRAAKKLVGAVDDDIIFGDAWLNNIVHVDDRNKVDEEWSRAVNSKSEYHHTYRMVNLVTGEPVKVTVHGRLIIDDKGEVSGWAGVITPYDQKNQLS